MSGKKAKMDYLCAPCCAKQDAARKVLFLEITDHTCFGLFGEESDLDWPETMWLDDIVANLKAAVEKAEKAL
jgi:hypothetical protein